MQHFAGAPKDMANLFERFVVNFFRREQTRYSVSGERLAWHEFRADPAATTHLPVMRTDVVLRSRYRTILIDCKFYEDALRATSSGLVVRPEHLYQITAYARNLRYTLPAQSRLDAMLLYPVVDAWHAVTLAADEYRVKIRFINLNQDWRCIHADLLKMVGIYGVSMNGGLATGDPRWSG
jgi:5-methylcytosine-specific restriction enzyme subunit McrC